MYGQRRRNTVLKYHLIIVALVSSLEDEKFGGACDRNASATDREICGRWYHEKHTGMMDRRDTKWGYYMRYQEDRRKGDDLSIE